MIYYKVNILLPYNMTLPVRLDETQLFELVEQHSKFPLFRNRNYGFYMEDGSYYKIDLSKVIGVEAREIGAKEVV